MTGAMRNKNTDIFLRQEKGLRAALRDYIGLNYWFNPNRPYHFLRPLSIILSTTYIINVMFSAGFSYPELPLFSPRLFRLPKNLDTNLRKVQSAVCVCDRRAA